MESYWQREAIIRRLAKTPRADFALRYFDIREATSVDDASWQPFQIQVINSTSPFMSMNKSRQIGASFTLAADAMFDGHMTGDLTVVMTSFNLEEAKEKIVYAKKWWESRCKEPAAIPIREEFDSSGNWQGKSPRRLDHWPELIKDNSLELVWDNRVRLISHPCRPPRGKKASVILDEFAHYQQDGPIYTAALPMVTRGRGRNTVKIASTPLGAQGKFFEIHSDPQKFPDFDRLDLGWWEVDDLCDPSNRVACIAEWLSGSTATELVRRFGTKQLKMLFDNTILEDFLQEYGLQFLDAVHAFIPWDLIKSCYPIDWQEDDEKDSELAEAQLADEYRTYYQGYKARAEGGDITTCMLAVDKFLQAVRSGDITGPFVWAYDVGRDNDPSELTVFEVKPTKIKQRLLVTMPQVKYDNQEAVIRYLLRSGVISRGMVDKGGIGSQLAEHMSEEFGYETATPITFDNTKKDKWAKTTKLAMERHLVTLIPDRDQDQQFHSIRRRASGTHMIYEIESRTSTVGGGKKVKHHADKFWVCAMAIYIAYQSIASKIVTLGANAQEMKTEQAHVTVASFGHGSRLKSRETSSVWSGSSSLRV